MSLGNGQPQTVEEMARNFFAGMDHLFRVQAAATYSRDAASSSVFERNMTILQNHISEVQNTLSNGLTGLGNAQTIAAQERARGTISFNVELPRYDGTRDFDNWISKIRRIMTAKHCWNTPDGLSWILTCLDGSALQFSERTIFTDMEDFDRNA